MTATGASKAKKGPTGIGGFVYRTFGSMKLAVTLFVSLGLLTWLGTLAQIEDGLWKAQKEYFESWFLIADLELSWWGQPVLPDEDGRGFSLRIPLPGAYPVMALLFLNLMVGGMLRMKWRMRNVGVLVVHVGIALLLVAGFVKMEFSYSGSLALFEAPAEGERDTSRVYESATFVSFHDYELALTRDNGDSVIERVVPESELLGAVGGTVTLGAEDLPFKVQVHHWMERCVPQAKGPMLRTTAPIIDDPAGGPGVFLRQLTPLPERSANVAGAYVTVLTAAGERFDGIVYGEDRRPYRLHRYPFTFQAGGERWALDLRRVLYDLPFHVRLQRFEKRDHPGTLTAADYRSFVEIPEEGDREVQIYMNTPLRKDGFVMYQTSWGPQNQGQPSGGPPWFSVFEVAENPSDKWPEYACWVIAAGLMIHFTLKLRRFLGSSVHQSLAQG